MFTGGCVVRGAFTIIVSGLFLAAAVVIPSPSAAKGAKTRVSIEATAEFIPAAHILVEHDAFTVPRKRGVARNGFRISRQTAVSVKGVRGERVMLSCLVETVDGDMRRADGANVHSRDCEQAEIPVLRSIVSGERALGTVHLTDDMLPNHKGKSHAGILIEVSYI